MNSIHVNQVLAQMRVMTAKAQGQTEPNQAGQASFGDLLKNSIDSVNETQKTAGAMKTAFEVGDPNVDLSDVMISVQKAGVAFQATVEIRNRLVEAYKDILNMPV